MYEGAIDNLVGNLNARGLLSHLTDDGDSRPDRWEMLRPAHFVPESMMLWRR